MMTRRRSPFVRDPLDDAALLAQATAAYETWRTNARGRGSNRQPFRLYLTRHARAVLSALQTDPRRAAMLPREMQRALKPPRGQRLGVVTLTQYAEHLTTRYLAAHRTMPFEDFLDDVRDRCATEVELRTFLGIAE